MRAKSQTEILYRMLRLLSGERDLTQRDIAKEMGISLGKTNNCLSELIRKKLVKVNPLRVPRHFYRFTDLASKGFLGIDRQQASQSKTNYIYVLTPEGLEEKSRMAEQLLKMKSAEYESIRKEIAELKKELSRKDLAEVEAVAQG